MDERRFLLNGSVRSAGGVSVQRSMHLLIWTNHTSPESDSEFKFHWGQRWNIDPLLLSIFHAHKQPEQGDGFHLHKCVRV